jgi:hypothetical protein
MAKHGLLDTLLAIDRSGPTRQRVLALETAFRAKIATHTNALLPAGSDFRKFNTSPFVLLIHAFHKGYAHVHQIEHDILPAKQFSSMETSAGRMVEEVALPLYGWECVPSEMHTPNSALDGRRPGSSPFGLATLKSGPRCLNDEMSENFADAILLHAPAWAWEAGVREIDFTYGVLYGTTRQSNKKDWHILRHLRDKVPQQPRGRVLVSPDGKWGGRFAIGGIRVNATVRIGADWWAHLGGPTCLVEILTALIRSCVVPAADTPNHGNFGIRDLEQIVDTSLVPANYNVSLLQRGQLPWLFLMACHFCDRLE